MVVWGYPCESKSSPAFKSKTPSVTRQRVFFIVRGKGYSTLQAAAENGYLQIVQLLIQQGADAHYKSEYTALQLAEMADQQQTVEYLMNL